MADVPTDHDIVHALADELPVGVWVARAPGGEFVYANRMFAEIMGQGGRDDVAVGGYAGPYGICTRDGQPYPEDRMPFVRALAEQRVVVVDDITIHRADRTYVHVRAFARPVTGPDGAITHVVICFFDVTREVEAEAARARAERLEAIGTLAGGIAHDFNNLIFGIKLLAAELAADEQDERRRASLALIDGITDRSAMLTRSLLGFARRGKHRVAPVALDDVIEGMRELLVRTQSNVTIELDLDAERRGTVIGDRSQLEQVVLNLVVNASEAIAEHGGATILVRTRSEDGWVVLEVIDDGPGIPPELRDRVLEPYFTTKTQGSQRGTGLGLSTVFGIVEGHAGALAIGAGIGGRGTTVMVRLPAAAEEAAVDGEPRAAEVTPGSGTVLVVDDDELVCHALAGALQSLGYDTYEANSGGAAVELVRAHRGDIAAVVLDMIMPGMNGRETFAAMRAVDPEIAVLLTSGHALDTDVQRLLEAGARGFVMKPYSVEELARSVADAMRATPAS